MKKKLWSADSGVWFGLVLLFSVSGFAFGVLVSKTWLLTLITLLLLVFTIYSFLEFFQRRMLEVTVNKRIKELGYTHILLNAEPVVKNFQFVGFRSQGVLYPVSISDGSYTVEVVQSPMSYVKMYEYKFSDPKNNTMVVFNQSEPPKAGGVSVFVK